MRRIYLDNAATTPMDKRVKKVMDKTASELFGNPSSIHKEGILARNIIENARKQVSDFFYSQPDEIVFTSGGVESNNLAIQGTFEGPTSKGLEVGPSSLKQCHAITSVIEHSSVLDTFRALENRGLRVTYVGVDENGTVSLKEIKEAMCEETKLVSIMYANNEIGSVQPISKIAKIVRDYKKETGNVYPLFHTDAAQALSYLDVSVARLGVDLLSASSSKIYGPKGVGILYIKRDTPISQILYGGGQERGLRAGTENTTDIIGCGEAMALLSRGKEKEIARMKVLQDFFVSAIRKNFSDAIINSTKDGLPNIVNISFPNTESEEMVLRLDAKGIACAGKSACQTSEENVSYVVSALGDGHYPESAVRFSMGRDTKKRDINFTIKKLKEIFTIIKQ